MPHEQCSLSRLEVVDSLILGRTLLVVRCQRFGRHITFGHILGKRTAIALARIAAAAAACALQEETFARLHVEARRGRALELILGAGPHHKACAATGLAAGHAVGWKTCLVEAA